MTPAQMLAHRCALLAETQALFDQDDEAHAALIDQKLTEACGVDRKILSGNSGDVSVFAAQLRLTVMLWDEGCPMPPPEIRALLNRLAAIVDGDWTGVSATTPERIAA